MMWPMPARRLGPLGQLLRRAHLLADGLRDVAHARLEASMTFGEQREALLAVVWL
jgi:hypothetical protein